MSYSYDRQSPPRYAAILYLLPLVAVAICAGLLIWRMWPRNSSGLDPNAKPRPVDARGPLLELETTNIDIYERAAPSVVYVENLLTTRKDFSLNQLKVPQGTGSGFIWDDDGHIVTNYHVVDGANAARVTLSDRSVYDVTQVWGYKDKDIAVLSIRAPRDKLKKIKIGTSHDLKVGQLAYAIGNPFGLSHTMTNGIISALGREVESSNGHVIHGAVQTSAPINPGNSGGPLLDSGGRLIGMTTAIISPSGASAGIGFAIPVDEINDIVPQLISNGKVVRPRLGVQIAEDQLARQQAIDKGALILKVLPDSAAAKAGLQGTSLDKSGQLHLGDVIVAIDGKAINEGKDLFAVLERYHPGDAITLTILRDAKRQEVKVTLQAAE
jgi:S1-C subfamily serine protease